MPTYFTFKILGNCNGDKWSEWAPISPYKTKDLLKFWSHDVEGNPLDNKKDPSSSYNPSQPFNGIDSLALIDPSFLVKPHFVSTESSQPSTQSAIKTTVKKEDIYVDSLQQSNYNPGGANLYGLPQERTSSTTRSTQSSSKTYDYNDIEDGGYGVVSNERSTSVKPSQSSFIDQNYPDYNPENIAILQQEKIATTNPTEAITLKITVQNNFPVYGEEPESVGFTQGERISTSKPLDGSSKNQNYPEYNPENVAIHQQGKIVTTNPTEAITLKITVQNIFPVYGQEPESIGITKGERISTSNPLDGAFTDSIYPDYNPVVMGEVPGRQTTLNSKTQSTSKHDKDINYQKPGDRTIGHTSPSSTTKYSPPSSLDYDYDPVPVALNCPQANICNQLSNILKKVTKVPEALFLFF